MPLIINESDEKAGERYRLREDIADRLRARPDESESDLRAFALAAGGTRGLVSRRGEGDEVLVTDGPVGEVTFAYYLDLIREEMKMEGPGPLGEGGAN